MLCCDRIKEDCLVRGCAYATEYQGRHWISVLYGFVRVRTPHTVANKLDHQLLTTLCVLRKRITLFIDDLAVPVGSPLVDLESARPASPVQSPIRVVLVRIPALQKKRIPRTVVADAGGDKPPAPPFLGDAFKLLVKVLPVLNDRGLLFLSFPGSLQLVREF